MRLKFSKLIFTALISAATISSANAYTLSSRMNPDIYQYAAIDTPYDVKTIRPGETAYIPDTQGIYIAKGTDWQYIDESNASYIITNADVKNKSGKVNAIFGLVEDDEFVSSILMRSVNFNEANLYLNSKTITYNFHVGSSSKEIVSGSVRMAETGSLRNVTIPAKDINGATISSPVLLH